jgi:hypothetical protein
MLHEHFAKKNLHLNAALAEAAASLVASTIGACRGGSRWSSRGGSGQRRCGFLLAAALVPPSCIADGVQVQSPPNDGAHPTSDGAWAPSVGGGEHSPPLPSSSFCSCEVTQTTDAEYFLRAGLSAECMPSRCSAQCRQDHLTWLAARSPRLMLVTKLGSVSLSGTCVGDQAVELGTSNLR